MAAVTTDQCLRFRDELITDASFQACMASMLPWELRYALNNLHAHRIAPIPIPGLGWLGTGYTIDAPASTAEIYQFPLIVVSPVSYTRLRYYLQAERTAGTATWTIKTRWDRAWYRGPSTGTFTAAMMGPSTVTETHAISTAGVKTFSATLEDIPVSGGGASIEGTMGRRWGPTGPAWAFGVVTVASSASGAGNTCKIYSLSAKLTPEIDS